MADPNTSYDWSGVTARAVLRMRKKKIVPVPEQIVKLAQAAYDGVTIPGENGEPVVSHFLEREFPSPEMAAAFVKLIKSAGEHTVPLSSVTATQDPDKDGNTKLVRWSAGARRGRAKPPAAPAAS